MATFAIGDVQGCWRTLDRLLARIDPDPDRDRLWLTGDLVNRGPDSLSVLRWARRHATWVTTVLGNHDLHLLARAAGVRPAGKRDTLDPILAAPDRDELLEWLRHQPLLVRDGELVLVHAGLAPSWSINEAADLADEVQEALRTNGGSRAFSALAARAPERWSDDLSGSARLAFVFRALTRLRTCTKGGRPCPHKGPPQDAPEGCLPWFDVPGRRSSDHTIVFGHWAALGFHRAPGVVALDSGCVWGQSLTAVRLDDGTVFSEPSVDAP